MKEIEQPNNLNHAILLLTKWWKNDLEYIKGLSEKEFLGQSHHGNGRMLRNKWFLWFQKDHKYPDVWPKEIPKIVKFFNDLFIFHADDMSGIILTSFYRTLHNYDIDLDKQVKHYLDYWKKEGVKNPLIKDYDDFLNHSPEY